MEYHRTPRLLYALTGFMIGLLSFAVYRYLAYRPAHTHYHANFAIYVYGVRDELKDPSFYEEVSACSATEIGPKHRAHLHGGVSDVVHVHDEAVTWGAFLDNIGYGASDKYLQARTKLYVATDTQKVHFVLNGQEVSDPTNTVIRDTDRLLISFGTDTPDQIRQQAESVARTAAEVDRASDPAACSGPDEVTWRDRLNHILH